MDILIPTQKSATYCCAAVEEPQVPAGHESCGRSWDSGFLQVPHCHLNVGSLVTRQQLENLWYTMTAHYHQSSYLALDTLRFCSRQILLLVLLRNLHQIRRQSAPHARERGCHNPVHNMLHSNCMTVISAEDELHRMTIQRTLVRIQQHRKLHISGRNIRVLTLDFCRQIF